MIALKIKNRESITKITIIVSLLSISCLLTYYFNIILRINIIFSHFFYLPIILASIWWKHKGILVSLFLAGLLMIMPFLTGDYIFFIENLLRATFLILIGIVIATLREHISKTDELQEAYDRNKFLKDLFTHDMSNILQSINSSAELYSLNQNKSRNLDDLDKYMNIIRENCLRGSILISNVRSFSGFEQSKIVLRPIEIFKVLNKSIELIKEAFQGKDIIIIVKQKKDELLVLANELLENIFDNILLNAIKHNIRSPIEIKIIISEMFREGENFVNMQFIDNAIGVENERKEVIFQQKNSGEMSFKRHGFGLTIVKKIIESYNGKIWVEDRVIGVPKNGSNFIIELKKAI